MTPRPSLESEPDAAWLERVQTGWFTASALPHYRLTRFVFLRALGFIYYVAFVCLARELAGLLSSRGILPVEPFLRRVAEHSPSSSSAFWSLPSLFWFTHSDGVLTLCAWIGVCTSLVVVAGYANAWLLAILWALYLSFVHIGQIFYGYGWEMLLLETGFLAIFLAPWTNGSPARADEPSHLVVLLLRWTLFRLMFGAGLIKIRGDACWVELTCLIHHYETQPNPHALSWLWHQAPPAFHQLSVLFNHFVELCVPWGYFGPRRVRHAAGALTIVFQLALVSSGNLSFLNWLTLAVALACFDDGFWQRVLPRSIVTRLAGAGPSARPTRVTSAARFVLFLVVLLLSINPVLNMLSPSQRMNASFDPLHLVNTYGAFGSVGKTRHEVVLEGAYAPAGNAAIEWREYQFYCKPGDVRKAPCWVTPFHRRLDWQMWFAALSDYERQPWIVSLGHRLLEGEPRVLGLLAHNPFPATPPDFVRARLYEYHFVELGRDGWWTRKLVGEYLRPLSLHDPELDAFLTQYGWL